jgi:hypothetical protein
MPLPASSATRAFDGRLCRELTRIGLSRQFKPFVYLNWPAHVARPKGKAPPFGGAFLTTLAHYAWFLGSQLPVILTVLTTLLLAGLLALALRILLLLAGLVASALLLTGGLVLLAGILALLLRHWGKLPCWTSVGR